MIPRTPRGVLVAVVAIGLGGATAFGLWHVVVGGLVRGNAGAGEFGVALAAIAGGLLVALAIAVRRSLRHA